MLKKLLLATVVLTPYVNASVPGFSKELEDEAVRQIGITMMKFYSKTESYMFKITDPIIVNFLHPANKRKKRTTSEIRSLKEMQDISNELGGHIEFYSLLRSKLTSLYNIFLNEAMSKNQIKLELKPYGLKNKERLKIRIDHFSRKIKWCKKMKSCIDEFMEAKKPLVLNAKNAWNYFLKNSPHCFDSSKITREMFLKHMHNYGLE